MCAKKTIFVHRDLDLTRQIFPAVTLTLSPFQRSVSTKLEISMTLLFRVYRRIRGLRRTDSVQHMRPPREAGPHETYWITAISGLTHGS